MLYALQLFHQEVRLALYGSLINLRATARPDVRDGMARIIIQIQVEGPILRAIVGIASHIGHTPTGKTESSPT